MPDGIDLSAGFIDNPQPRRAKTSRLDDLINFAKEHKLTVGSTTGGRHNRGSKHYSGNAIDIKGSGAFDDAKVNALKQAAAERGLLLRDERRRPLRQKVWGGPHVHIEAADIDLRAGIDNQKQSDEIDLSAGFEVQGQDTPPITSSPTIAPATQPARAAIKPSSATPVPVSTGRFGTPRDKRYSRPLRPRIQPPEIIDAGTGHSMSSGLIERPVTPAMSARQPGIIERAIETIKPYVPGLTSIDTPAGIKMDAPRGFVRGITLGAAGESRQITPEERLITPDAETRRNFAEGVGETAGALVPYIGAGRVVSKVPMLARAGRAPAAARTGLTFGGVETAREAIHSAKTGEAPDPKEVAISTGIGAAMGGIPGLNAGIKQRLFAAVAPQVTADVARGVPLEQAAQAAITNVLFEAAAGRKLGLSKERIGELRKQIESRQTVPTETQRRLVTPERIEDATTATPSEMATTQPTGTSVSSRPIEVETVRTRPSVDQWAPIELRGNDVVSETESARSVQRFAHKDFGQVTEAESQAGVPKGSIRVVDEGGIEHTILKPKGTGAGNIRAIPIKEPSVEVGKELAGEPVESRKVDRPAIAGKQPWEMNDAELASWYRSLTIEHKERVLNGRLGPRIPVVLERHPVERPPTPSVSEGAQLPERGTIARNQPKELKVATPQAEGTARGAGMQGEVTPPAPEPSITSARQEMFKADRAELDLPDLPPAERKGWQVTLDNAKQKGLDKQADLLADEVIKKPRALDDEQTAGLVIRSQELKNEHKRILSEIDATKDPDVISQLRSQLDAVEQRFDINTRAAKQSGTEKGRALASQKLTINQDFDLVSVLQRAKAAKGRELEPKERVKFEEMTKQIEELSGKLSAAEVKLKETELQKQINRVARSRKRQETVKVLEEEFVLLKTEFAQARKEAKGVQAAGLAGIDPEGKLTPIILKMARNRVKAGVVKAEDVVDNVYNAVREHVEGVSRDDIRDVLAGHDLERDPLPAIKTRLRKQEAELTRRLEEKDFSPPPKQKSVVYDREASNLKAQVEGLKRKIGAEIRGSDSKLETILAMRKAGMLTGLRTHARNIGGTGAFQAFEEVARVPGSLADLLVSTVTKRRALGAPNPVAVAKSSYEAATKGVREAVQIMKYGATAEDLAKFERPRELNSGSRLIDTYVNTVFRTLGAEDKIFRTYAFKRSIEDQARLRAKEIGKPAKELAENPTTEMVSQAMLDAEVATFNNQNTIADKLTVKNRVGNAAIDLVLPFKRTPANIFSRLIESTPLGLAKPGYRVATGGVNKKMSFEDQRKFSQTIGRSVTGSSLLALGYWLAANDLATGLSESDAGDREVQKAAGRPPLAVRIGDTWHQIGAFSPMGNLIAVGAALHREQHRPPKEGEEPPNVLAAAAPVAAKVMLEQPFLKGASGVVEAVREPGRRTEAFIGQTASSFVPTIVADTGSAIDNTRRERRGIIDRVQERIPIARERLPEDIDVFAQPLQSRRSAFVDPTLTSGAKDDPFLRELIRLDVGVPKTNKKPGESDGELRDRRVRQGKELANSLAQIVASGRYKQLSDEEKKEVLKQTIEEARKRANAGTNRDGRGSRRRPQRPARLTVPALQ